MNCFAGRFETRQTFRMRLSRGQLLALFAVLIIAPFVGWAGLIKLGLLDSPAPPEDGMFRMSDRISTIRSVEVEGVPRFEFRYGDQVQLMEPDAFWEALRERQGVDEKRSPVFRTLDITGWAGMFGIVFGFVAQAVFMSRMALQWLASERAKRSVVPVAFWWLSLIGAEMLMVYFVWRREPVGLIGQSFGWVIYMRNLWLIYTKEPDRESEE